MGASVSLPTLWQSSPKEIEKKHIKQLVRIAGDGKGKKGSSLVIFSCPGSLGRGSFLGPQRLQDFKRRQK
jgi:hypothetical protein